MKSLTGNRIWWILAAVTWACVLALVLMFRR